MDDFHDRWSHVRDHDYVAGARWSLQTAVTLLVQVIGHQMIMLRRVIGTARVWIPLARRLRSAGRLTSRWF